MNPVTPKKAAACVLLTDGPETEILLGKRNERLRFMGGTHVFPGGRVDPSESTFHVKGAEDEDFARSIHAAVRETFEETGILCAEGALPSQEEIDAARMGLLAEDERFEEILDRFDLTVDASQFTPCGRWVTPEASPIRFDTHYFVHRYSGPRNEKLIEGELVALSWMTPKQARRKYRKGEIRFGGPVSYVVQCFGRFAYPDMLEPLSKAARAETGVAKHYEVRAGIRVIPLVTHTIPPATHTNCFLVGEDEAVVVDPGPHDEGETYLLLEQLEFARKMGAELKAIVLTHSHRDHIGAVEAVRDRFKLPVWAHRATHEQVAFDIDRYIEDGERITLRGDPPWVLRAIHTPGHDPGHLCFLEESSKVLIAGDLVGNPGTIVVSLEYRGDMTEYLDSLRTILDEEFDVMVPSHGRRMRDGKAKIQETIDHRLMREAKVKAALDRGLTTIEEILPVAYDDTPKEVWPLAEHALKAHLKRLEEIG